MEFLENEGAIKGVIEQNNSLIRKITNFKPKISFEEGLSETIRWFKLEKNLKFYKENIFNI